MILTGLQYLLDALESPEFEDARDTVTERWDVLGKIIDDYHEEQTKQLLPCGEKGYKGCESYFGDYKCHVETNVKDSKGNYVWVDKCIKEAVENLNAKGLKTVASCCGHGIIQPKITIG